MAVAPSPNSKASVSAPIDKENKKKMLSTSGEQEEAKSATKPDSSCSEPPKRNMNPGVRVIRGRIYDSQNGTTCHQCRQKTYAVSVNCKNQARTKPCTLKYCRTCLLNRYGEKAEDVSSLDEWSCPKCRGVCNCSICMKKRGHQPTGMVAQMAKAGGFSSVSDMIHVKGAENVSNYKRVKETCASPRKKAAPAEGNTISSPKKPGKENLFDGKTDANADASLSIQSPIEEKPKKMKRKRFEVDGSVVNGVSVTESNHALNEKKQKKMKTEGSKEFVAGNVNCDFNGNNSEEKNSVHEGGRYNKKVDRCVGGKKYSGVEKNAVNKCNNSFEAFHPLPKGSELVTVAGVDLPKEDAGNALQFLEFCATFGKILDVKKGEAEAVLRDLIKGRSTRRGKHSLVIQFHIQLLSVIQDESDYESESDSPILDPTHGNDSWLKALKSCIPKSQYLPEHMDCIDGKTRGYDDLDSSVKLRLLIFLCDEVLGTNKIRNWIDDQNAKFAEKRKEAKDKLSAAKDKEKSLKQKMQDDVAKAIIAKDGVPLTMLEHDAIVSKIKNEVAEAHAEVLACKKLIPIDKERPHAIRTEPIFRDNNGHVYWRLKWCSEKSDILHQDIGTGDQTVEPVDKWFQYDAEQMDLVGKHINVLRLRFRKGYKNHVMCSA